MSKENLKIGGNITQFYKNYIASVLQMGVPVLDVDWNNFQDIVLNIQRETLKLVGGAGSVFYSDGLLIEKMDNGRVKIKAGTWVYKGFVFTLYEDLEITKTNANLNDRTTSGDQLDLTLNKNFYYKLSFKYVDYTEDPNLVHPLLNVMRCARLQLVCEIYYGDTIEADVEMAPDTGGFWDIGLNLKVASVSGTSIVDERESYDTNTGLLDDIMDNKANHEAHIANVPAPANAVHGKKFVDTLNGYETATDVFASTKAIYDYFQAFQQGQSMQTAVEAIQNDPPGSPVDDERYIIGDTPTGAWSGHADEIAQWSTELNPDAWTFTEPETGFLVQVKSPSPSRYWVYTTQWEESNIFNSLVDLQDVDITSPGASEEGYAVVWNNTSKKFELREVAQPNSIDPYVISYTAGTWHTVTFFPIQTDTHYWVYAQDIDNDEYVIPEVKDYTLNNVKVRFPTTGNYRVLIIGGEAWSPASFPELSDVTDSSLSGKAGYSPVVNDDELGISLKRVATKDVVVATQAEFNAIIERTTTNTYRFKSEYRSVYCKYLSGGYDMQSFLSGGDTYGFLHFNNCSHLQMDPGSYFYYGDNNGYFYVDCEYAYIKDVTVKGLGSSAAPIIYSFYITQRNLTFENVTVKDRYSSVTMSGFRYNASDAFYRSSKFINCTVDNLKTTASDKDLYGFYNAHNVVNCRVENMDAALGAVYPFQTCKSVTNCTVHNIDSGKWTNVFNICERVSNCRIEDVDALGDVIRLFNQCIGVSNCSAKTLTATGLRLVELCHNVTSVVIDSISFPGGSTTYGFYQSEKISACEIKNVTITTSGSFRGFDTCKRVSACAVSNITSSDNAALYGYNSCRNVSACYAYDFNGGSGGGNVIGFNDCHRIASCEANDLVNAGGPAWGFNSSYNLSSCEATLISSTTASSAYGFNDCRRLDSCTASYISSTAANAYGFNECELIASCEYSLSFTAPSGTIYGFHTCQYLASVYAPGTYNNSNCEWVDIGVGSGGTPTAKYSVRGTF